MPKTSQSRRLLLAGIAAAALVAPDAMAQGLSVAPITPENELERAFIGAFANPALRPAFRRHLLEEPVALVLAGPEEGAAPLLAPLREGARAGMIFTSPARLRSALGPNAAFVVLPGRQALERLRGASVALNFRLIPMLTLEAADVAEYLGAAAASAGPAQ